MKGLRVSIVKPDVVEDVLHQIGDGAEDAAPDAIAGDQTQPDFDLVQPRRVGGRKVKVHAGMALLPGPHDGALMNHEVIQDHMDGFSAAPGDCLIQERHELLAGVPRGTTSGHLAAVHLQRREQRDGAVADILHPAALGLAGPQGQRRLAAIQGLNDGFLIDAENRRIFEGSRYRPSMSLALASKSESGLAM